MYVESKESRIDKLKLKIKKKFGELIIHNFKHYFEVSN